MKKALLAAVILAALTSTSFTVLGENNIAEKNYTAEELIEGSDALDNYIDELEIVTIGVRENDSKLVVGCHNLTEEKKKRIKEITKIENIEFIEYKNDYFDSGKKEDYDEIIKEAINSCKTENLEITFTPAINTITVKHVDGSYENIEINNDMSFIDENGVTYINVNNIKDFVQEYIVPAENNEHVLYFGFLVDGYMKTTYENFVILKQGESIAKYSGGSFDMGSNAVLKNNKLYVPLRGFLKGLGFDDSSIKYNSDNKEITVLKNSDFLKNLYNSFNCVNDNSMGYLIDESIYQKAWIPYDDFYFDNESKDYKVFENIIKENFDPYFDIENYSINEIENNTQYYIYNIETDNGERTSYSINVSKYTGRILFAGIFA